jgi:carboxyl-terminal processing protease
MKLSRAAPVLPSVEEKLMPGQVGYLRPFTLSPAKVKEVAAAIDRLQKQGAQKLVLDLRSCAVGAPEDGVALANLFLNKGRITYLQGQRVQRQNMEADPAKAVTALPMAVLTNRGTAGGAEIAAAALADNKRAETVGERTYGDASLRRAVTMDDGAAIILSVAKYYSPNGKSIQDNGVTPANLVSEPETQAELDENGDPLPDSPEQPQPQRKLDDDPLYKKAVEVLGVKA